MGAAFVAAGPVMAAGYNSAVLSDTPAAYWRLGEPDGAATAADASGSGISLNYTTAALLDEEAGIEDEADTSLAVDSSTAASRTGPMFDSFPATFEGWIRTNVPDTNSTVYSYQSAGGNRYDVTVDVDGLLHASIVFAAVCCQDVTMTGPSDRAITDGLWHYVVVDFATHYAYVDLAAGPQGTIEGSAPQRARPGDVRLPDSMYLETLSLGGPDFYGQLDEVAVYPLSLSSAQMSAHATAGGLGWDDAFSEGGEEASSPNCPEYGVFWSGFSAPTGGAIAATGAVNFITTSRKRVRCTVTQGSRSGGEGGYSTGQTVRIKFGGDDLQHYGKYVEFGPVQYFCSPTVYCYGLYFNYRDAGTGVNYHPFAASFPLGCTTVGTHAYKVQHVGSNWIGYFSCSTTSINWVEIARHNDSGSGPGGRWTSGRPDVEGFVRGVKCGATVARANCWKREATMSETHSHFQWIDGSGLHNVPYARCRFDTSYRWNGRRLTTTPPISVDIFQDPQSNPASPGNPAGPNGNGCSGP